MRLHLILPRVEPEEINPPSECPYEDCDGARFQFLQEVEKPLRDTKYCRVAAQRYQCLRCFRTHRVYPKGVSKDHISQRVKGLDILLYLLGLSYGAVSLALDALGVYVCKSRVYDAVQAAAERVPGMERDHVFENVRTPALGGDLTSLNVKGQWHTLGLTVDDTTGLVLTVEGLSGEDAAGLDPDQSSLHEHRALALRLACGLAEALPYADGSFDLLCCSWVLEHLPDPAHAFTEVVRVLAPGGHFVFLTPNRRHPLLLLNRALGWTQGRLVGRFYDRAEADTFPAFYRANTPAQIERLARATRLTRVSLRFVGDPTYLAFSTSHCSGWPACWSTSHRARCGCTWRGSTCRCSVAVANSMPQPVIL